MSDTLTARQQHLQYLRRPYELGHARPVPENVASLKKDILALVRRTRNADDYCQSKYHAKDKVRRVARVPDDYYWGSDLAEIERQVSSLREFVMKPNHLSRGIGVRALRRDGEVLRDMNGDVLTSRDVVEECECILSVERFGAPRAIILEERVYGHPAFGRLAGGIPDIRLVFYRNRFLYCVARMPSQTSGGYANVSRGADRGVVLENGEYVNDDRFQAGTISSGRLPFFADLLKTGLRVKTEYGAAFLAVDMTVDRSENVVVIETDVMVQMEYSLTDKGIDWLRSVMKHDLATHPGVAKLLFVRAALRRAMARRFRRLPRVW